MKVMLLSAYSAQSHVQWQESLQSMFARWQWRVLSLPPRYFSWRARGNALYWSMQERELLEEEYDLLVATSMVDLATLRGLVPALAHIPSIVYFHENQFAYPQTRHQHSLLEIQLTSMYSAIAADCILFNSKYNQHTFMDGCQQLLQKMPDRVPPGIVAALYRKSEVVPVPVRFEDLETHQSYWPGGDDTSPRALRLLWVGRFEHDKGGQQLLRILMELESCGVQYELAVIGQKFRAVPAVFGEIESGFRHRLVQFGYVEKEIEYRALLRAADIVLSTALHEFQGLAVIEAVALQCVPVVPDRLVYPEIYPSVFCYASTPNEPDREAVAAVSLIQEIVEKRSGPGALIPDVSIFDINALAPVYRRVFQSVAARQRSQ